MLLPKKRCIEASTTTITLALAEAEAGSSWHKKEEEKIMAKKNAMTSKMRLKAE